MLYRGVGNPKPDYDAAARKGDNLYTNSVVALRGATGELAWHFQFVAADNRDWGANQIPVLVNYPQAGASREAHALGESQRLTTILVRPRKGHVPVRQAVRPSDLDHRGWRPRAADDCCQEKRQERRLLYPGNCGRDALNSLTYYPSAISMILPVLGEWAWCTSKSFGSPPRASGRAFYTAVRALNARTGELVWERKHEPRLVG